MRIYHGNEVAVCGPVTQREGYLENVRKRTRGVGSKNRSHGAYVLFEWPLTVVGQMVKTPPPKIESASARICLVATGLMVPTHKGGGLAK